MEILLLLYQYGSSIFFYFLYTHLAQFTAYSAYFLMDPSDTNLSEVGEKSESRRNVPPTIFQRPLNALITNLRS